MKVRLKKSGIDCAEYVLDGPSAQYIWDSQLQGFGVRLYRSGKKSFVIQYRYNGRLRFMVLGQYGPLTLDEARKEAKKKLVAPLTGKDPLKERQDARIEFLTATSLQHLFDQYTAKPSFRSKSMSHQKGFVQKFERNILPHLGRMKVKEIERRHLRVLLEEIADTGKHQLAKQVQAFTRILFNFAVDQELIEHSPCERLRLDLNIQSRDRVLSEDEIRCFWYGVENIGVCPQIQIALKLQLVTAQRIGEIAKAEWRHVDLKQGIWTIPRENAKNRRGDHLVPLSPLARRLIDELTPFRDESGWLLPSPKATGVHVAASSMTRAIWKERDKGAFKDLAPFTPHDLRRTAASMLSREEVERSYIKQILNHTENDVTSVYIRDDYLKSKRRYLDLWANKLDRILEQKLMMTNVVSL